MSDLDASELMVDRIMDVVWAWDMAILDQSDLPRFNDVPGIIQVCSPVLEIFENEQLTWKANYGSTTGETVSLAASVLQGLFITDNEK